MLVAMAFLAAISLLVAGTAVVVSGGVVFLAIALVVGVLEVTVLPLVLGEGFALLDRLVTNAPLVVGATGLLSLPLVYYRPVRSEIRTLRAELTDTGTLAADRHPEVAGMVRRLAQQATIATPDVYIVNRRRPESYALGGRSDGTIVITRGVVRALSDRELQAVLAHEIAHLANGDSRILNLALVPMLVAERVGSDDRPQVGKRVGSVVVFNFPVVYLAHLASWALVTAITWVQSQGVRFGVAFLSRGREFAADRTAARLTGSPSALASALRKLDDERGSPGEDMRSLKRSASALDILPYEADHSWGPFRTHPGTEERIERLRRLATELETERR
jgi:heat shock protein HtpX